MNKNIEKNKKSEEMKEKIYDAAGIIFSKKGYYQANMKHIAKEADMAVGTIYNYFDNKEDLMSSLLKDKFREYKEGLTKELEGITDFRERFKRRAVYTIQHFKEHPHHVRILFVQLINLLFVGDISVSSCKEIYDIIINEIKDELEEGKKLNNFNFTGDSYTVANILFGAFKSFIIKTLIMDNKVEEKDIDAYLSFIFNALDQKY